MLHVMMLAMLELLALLECSLEVNLELRKVS